MPSEKATEKMMQALLRHALFGTSLEGRRLSDDEYQALMQLSRRQTVQGLVGGALMDAGYTLSHSSAMDLFMETERLKRSNGMVSAGLQKMALFLQRHHLSFVIVKGQMMGSLYPHPERRCPGDVDLYFPGDNYEKAKGLVEKLTGKQLSKLSDGKHVEVSIDSVIFELHNILSQLARPSHQQWFNTMIDEAIARGTDEAVILGTSVPTLAPTENILFVFMHLFFHLTASGVGLRQFCDLAMLIHHKGKKADGTRLEDLLRHLGYDRAFRAIAAFLVSYFGLPQDEVPLTLSDADFRWSETIRKNVLANGNFGRSRRRVKEIGILHSLDSARLNIHQMMTFCRLAPQEVTGRFWSLGRWTLMRFKIKSSKKHNK
ncbi:MAG: nucleotidyltransferase family protein [Prevotellaceae bacterium]|nr:nucleotidyltransferase family protein [Prevotellaceae bacterium]